MRALTVSLAALMLSLVFTPVVRRLAVALRVIDHPGRRKVHRTPMPRLGGVAVYAAWAAALLLAAHLPRDAQLMSLLKPVIVLGGFVVLFGAFDDRYDLPGRMKLLGQVIAASLIFSLGYRIELITNPFGGDWVFPLPLSYLLTVLWVVGMMNAVNLIDGLDGLATGIVGIASLGLIFASFQAQAQASMVIFAALAGACAGFLRYNFHPASIFLGDSGSQMLGYLMAVTPLMETQYKAAAAAALLVPLTALALPIFDTGLAFIRRVRWRQSIFRADKYHLHHRLLKMGLSHEQVVLFMYLICGYLSLMAVLFVVLRDRYALVLLVLLALGMFVGMQVLRFVELKFLAFRRRTMHRA